MNCLSLCLNLARMFPLWLLVWMLCALPSPVGALDPERGYGEPYELGGNRIVFTTWAFVRPGQLDWLDENNKSVYARSEKGTPGGPWMAHFDNYEEPYGVRLTAEPAQIEGPIIKDPQPWEANVSAGTLMFDEGRYRFWGGIETPEKEGFTCYFESTDGVNWTRPNLGLVEYQGSNENNLIPKEPNVGFVFKDPTAPPQERFKTVKHEDLEMELFEQLRQNRPYVQMSLETDPGRVHSIRAAVSPDGFTWTPIEQAISVEPSDTQVICHWNPILEKYVMFTRSYMVVPRAKSWDTAPDARRHQFIPRRAIGRTESADFRNFNPSETIIETGNDMPPTDTYYTNCQTTIPGAPDQFVMFPAIYHLADDTTSIELWTSYDTELWHRMPEEPVARTGNFGDWTGGCLFATPELTERPDGSWVLPFTGYSFPHKYPRSEWGFDAGFLTWAKGRLIALEAADRGQFSTIAFLAPGNTVKINAVTARAGSILVEAAGLNGVPFEGFSFDDAEPVIGDQYRTVLRWSGGERLPIDAGEPVMFRFRINKAKIYALDFE